MKFEGQSGIQTRELRLTKQAASTTAPGPQSGLFTITCDKAHLGEIDI